ncbi:MAG: hypothetical protein IH621_01490 [Krumholzibacteria bacterium]|nr:hypothetical protein [Candidatus Krumholzibacteria bacterium]
MKVFFTIAILLLATSAAADVIFGAGGREFSQEDWVVTGDAEIMRDAILFPTRWTTAGSNGAATVASLGVAEGIVVDVLYGGWTSSRSLEIVDDTGTTRIYMWMVSPGTVRATAFGIVVGDIPYNYGDRLRVSVFAPTSTAIGYQWRARVENLTVGESAEYSEPGESGDPFVGPITVRVRCGYGVGGSVEQVAVLGDGVVPIDDTTWGALKAIFR